MLGITDDDKVHIQDVITSLKNTKLTKSLEIAILLSLLSLVKKFDSSWEPKDVCKQVIRKRIKFLTNKN